MVSENWENWFGTSGPRLPAAGRALGFPPQTLPCMSASGELGWAAEASALEFLPGFLLHLHAEGFPALLPAQHVFKKIFLGFGVFFYVLL